MVFGSEKREDPVETDFGYVGKTATKSRRGHQNVVTLNNESLNRMTNLQHGSKKKLYFIFGMVCLNRKRKNLLHNPFFLFFCQHAAKEFKILQINVVVLEIKSFGYYLGRKEMTKLKK